MPKVSVLIPVYNVEPYIRQCLDSVVNQTLKDIEIICVDDCSPDNSFDICRQYARDDARFRLLAHQKNKGILAARKTAVEAATSDYIMFLDSDDALESNACERAYAAITQVDVDILQFGAFVDATDDFASSAVTGLEKYLNPCQERISGRQIFIACFRERRFSHSLWNKIYRATLCKHAFSHLPADKNITAAEDFYATFVMTYFAASFHGISDKFYHYHYGRSMSKGTMDLETIECQCTQSIVVRGIQTFLTLQGTFEKYYYVYYSAAETLIKYNFSLLDRLPEEVRPAAAQMFIKWWDGIDEAQSILVQLHDEFLSSARTDFDNIEE